MFLAAAGSMRRYFERYGEITDCIVMKNPNQDPTLKKNKSVSLSLSLSLSQLFILYVV